MFPSAYFHLSVWRAYGIAAKVGHPLENKVLTNKSQISYLKWVSLIFRLERERYYRERGTDRWPYTYLDMQRANYLHGPALRMVHHLQPAQIGEANDVVFKVKCQKIWSLSVQYVQCISWHSKSIQVVWDIAAIQEFIKLLSKKLEAPFSFKFW